MATEKFSTLDFEMALSKALETSQLQFATDGFIYGELRFHIDVRPGVRIQVNSSIDRSGFASDTGDNSIRVWLTNESGKPLAKKEQKYVTRVAGWQTRLAKVLKETLQTAEGITVQQTFDRQVVADMAHKQMFADAEAAQERDAEISKAAYKRSVESNGSVVPNCPKCGAVMVQRTRRSDNAPFWGCSKYPSCNGTRNIETASKYPEQGKTKGQLVADALAQAKAKRETSENGTAVATVDNPEPVKTFEPSKYQKAIFEWVLSNTMVANRKGLKALVVEALAGSGKTTTGIEMLKIIPSNLDVLFVAFGKDIARSLQRKLGERPNIKISTFHSLGFKPTMDAYANGKSADVFVKENKLDALIDTFLDKQTWKHIYGPIKQIVGLLKANLMSSSREEIMELVHYHGIELNGDGEVIIEAAQRVFAMSVKQTGVIDYDDMCYFPVFYNLPLRQYDVIFIDEAQDTNKVQIAMALKSVKPNGIVIAVGDRHQSIYGFRGADARAIPNLIEALGADVLPLSITYRNPKVIVDLVRQKFPAIPLEAPDTAIEGAITRDVPLEKMLETIKPGDVALCRCNAPLVKPAFALISRGVKAVIRGRDIGKGLVTLVDKMKASTMVELMEKLENYKMREMQKLLAAEQDNAAQVLEDKVATIYALAEGINSIEDLTVRITNIFSDEVEGVVFSSCHKSKGLEFPKVWILEPQLMPHPSAKQPWEQDQEQNLEYVAITRVQQELVYVLPTLKSKRS